MDQAELERPHSRQWWESRTGTELQDIIRSGFSAGDATVQAHREIERRAHEMAEAEDQKVVKKNSSIRLQILGGALAVLLLLLLIMKLVV